MTDTHTPTPAAPDAESHTSVSAGVTDYRAGDCVVRTCLAACQLCRVVGVPWIRSDSTNTVGAPEGEVEQRGDELAVAETVQGSGYLCTDSK